MHCQSTDRSPAFETRHNCQICSRTSFEFKAASSPYSTLNFFLLYALHFIVLHCVPCQPTVYYMACLMVAGDLNSTCLCNRAHCWFWELYCSHSRKAHRAVLSHKIIRKSLHLFPVWVSERISHQRNWLCRASSWTQGLKSEEVLKSLRNLCPSF